MVTRGKTVGALAVDCSRQVAELEGALHRVNCMTEAEAVILTVSCLTKADYVRDSTLAELRSAPEVEFRDASRPRVDVNSILDVRRRSVEEDDDEELPVAPNVRHSRSRSLSPDKDRRRHY